MFLNKIDTGVESTSLPTLFNSTANAFSRRFIMGKFSYWPFSQWRMRMTKRLIPATAMTKIAATTMSRYEPGTSSSSASIEILSFVYFGTCATQTNKNRSRPNQRPPTD